MRASQAAGLLRPRESPPLPPLGPPGIRPSPHQSSGWPQTRQAGSGPGLVLILEGGSIQHTAGWALTARTLPTPPTPPPPCPYQQSPPPRLVALVSAQEQGSAQQQHGHHGQGQDTRVDCTTSPVRRAGSQGHPQRFPGPREPDPHFSAGAPRTQGQHPTPEFWEGGTPGFQHPFCWTISAGPSTSPPPVSASKSASAFQTRICSQGRGPVVGVDLPGPAQATRTSPSTPHPPAPAPPTCPWKSCRLLGLRERGTC